MRLFVAIGLTDGIKEKLNTVTGEMKSRGVLGNYTRTDNIHITLAFIGETVRVADARKCVASVDFEPFDLSLKGTGYFGSIFWAGIEKNANLDKLAGDVRKALTEKGFAIDDKPFKPHITLIREASQKADVSLPRCGMTVNEIKLMKSERINGKLVYTLVYVKKSV